MTSSDLQEIQLPPTTGIWNRSDEKQELDAQNIFQYMDGAGELYVGYRFDRLEVIRYTSTDADEILVELYWMKTSDDAFGLLSTDWGGDPVKLTDTQKLEKNARIPASRALYGAGLLRLWSGNLYARIMAYRETDASKKAVLNLGHALVVNRNNPPPPSWLGVLSPAVELNWSLMSNRVVYLRSYLVLNSAYFLSSKNILNLDNTTEAVFAPYEQNENKNLPKRLQTLTIHYPDTEKTIQALQHFQETYLPEQPLVPSSEESQYFPIEDGWFGCRRHANNVILVFESPTRETAQSILQSLYSNILAMEKKT